METKKIVIIVIIAVVVIVGGVIGYTLMTGELSPTKTTIDLYNNEQKSVSRLIDLYKDDDNVDNETIKWLESFDSSYVVLEVLEGSDGFIIMKRDEANRIPSDNDTSIMTKVVIKALVKETHNLGTGLSDVSLVEKVEFVKRQAI